MMPGIIGLVAAISVDVVTKLAAIGYPALQPGGAILVGRQHQYEQASPPRVIFIPTKSVFGPRGTYSPSNLASNRPYSADNLEQIATRSIATEFVTFEVRCWGVGTSDDDSFDATQVLYQQVIASTHLLTVGSYKLENGVWTDSKTSGTQIDRYGREFVFGLTFGTPVLDAALPLPFAPGNTVQTAGVVLNGATSEAIQVVTP